MSFGGGFNQQYQPSPFEQRQEMEAMMDMYSRLMDQCFKKCVTHFNENDLSKGESTCIDRCTVKYLEMQQKIGQRLALMSQETAKAHESISSFLPQQTNSPSSTPQKKGWFS